MTDKKHIGFRVTVSQYIEIIKAAESLSISITDYLLSKVFYAHDNHVKQVKSLEETVVKHVLNSDKQKEQNVTPVLQPKTKVFNTVKKQNLFSEENEKLLQTLNN